MQSTVLTTRNLRCDSIAALLPVARWCCACSYFSGMSSNRLRGSTASNGVPVRAHISFISAGVRAVFAVLFISVSMSSSARAQEIEDPGKRADPVKLSSTATSHNAPLTLSRRYRWAALSSVSGSRIAGYAFSSALSTMNNDPVEYGPHWQGFGKRVGMRLANGATGTMMEASIGALWNEDPRYDRAVGQPLNKRLAHVAVMTFFARDRKGQLMPAYARYISVPANSYASNAWRADSEASRREAALRIPMAFLNRAIGNAFSEFWPDATKWLHRD
jgi:hypothetical protein